MPDLEIIRRHLASFTADLENLKKHKDVSVEKIKADTDLLWILERGMYLLLQNLFDMLAHIVAADFHGNWESYSEISDILYQHEVISEEDKETLNKMAGFRNRLSHEYLSLDMDVLVDIVNNRLPDFSRFLSVIKNYCKI